MLEAPCEEIFLIMILLATIVPHFLTAEYKFSPLLLLGQKHLVMGRGGAGHV